MTIAFEKYQGTGNDFILINDTNSEFPEKEIEKISLLCHRHFGIGSDGLMLLQKSEVADFKMVFFNPDGSKSLCGNGSRCAVHFAERLGLAGKSRTFETTDGTHEYRFINEKQIGIRMHDISDHTTFLGHTFIHTGSPHLSVNVDDVDAVDVYGRGRALRFDPVFEHLQGTNVNFVSAMGGNAFGVRTYERGVENETLSCGTGVTAVALAKALEGSISSEAEIHTHGGVLKVRFEKNGNNFNNIWLEGPVAHVFSGEINA